MQGSFFQLVDKIPKNEIKTLGISRSQDTDPFETIFYRILKEAVEHGFVDPEVIFIGSTHIKAQEIYQEESQN